MKAKGSLIQTLRSKSATALAALLVGIFLASCGAQQNKKGIEEVVDLDETGVGNTTPSTGVLAMKKSSGRYEAEGAKACPETANFSTKAWMQKMRKKVKFGQAVATNSDEQSFPDSGHFYLYEARSSTQTIKVTVHGTQRDSKNVVTKEAALANIGLQIRAENSTAGNLYNIYATSFTGQSNASPTSRWGRIGFIKADVLGYNMKLDISTRELALPNESGSVSDSEFENKKLAANFVLEALSAPDGFQLEYFSDPAANQILLLTGVKDGVKYEAEFGRESQPLKPLPCTGRKYIRCTNHSACNNLPN